MLALVDSLLRAFERIDRLVAKSIGSELIYKKVLKEMGAEYFDYEITLTVVWPIQMQLGGSSNPASVSPLIDQVHRDLLRSLDSDSANASEIIDSWDKQANKGGFANSLIYLAPSVESLQQLLNSFISVAHNLDVRIVLEGSAGT